MAVGKLNRTLGLAECIFFGAGSILGAGIYALIGKVAGEGGNLTWLAFTIASVTALFSAFAYAELSAAFPKAGGEYVYMTKAMGKHPGVGLGFIVSLNGIITGATVSLGFAGYLSQLVEIPLVISAIAIIALIFIINTVGIRQSSVVNIIFTIIEVGGLIFVISAAAPHLGEIDYFELPPTGINGLLTASALSFFAYVGFEEIVKLAEESKDPHKNIPRALFIASGIVMLMYIVVAVCAVSAIPWQELDKSNSPLADVVNNRFGKAGGLVIIAIALFATSNTILSNMLGSSRVLFSMAKDVSFLKRFAYVLPKRKTPVFALLLVLGVMCAFASLGEIETVARIANFFIFITFLAVNVAVIKLRITDGNMKRPFRIPGNIRNIPVISIAAIIMTSVLIGYTVFALIIE